MAEYRSSTTLARLRREIAFGVLAVLVLLTAAPGRHVVAGADVHYCTEANNPELMTIFTPPGSGPFPAVLYVHSGSWSAGDRLDDNYFDETVRALLKRGVAVATIDYHLAAARPFPAALDDVLCAARFLRDHGAAYDIDGARVAAWGASAGGHLVALAAEREPSLFRTVADWYGPADLDGLDAGTSLAQAVVAEFGAAPRSHSVLLARASPAAMVRPGMPPFLLVHGTADAVVPFAQSSEFATRLRQAHVPVRLVAVAHGGHAFTAAGGDPDPSPAAIVTITADYLAAGLS